METIGITELRARLSEDFVRDLDTLTIVNRKGQTVGQITGQAYQPQKTAEPNTDPRVPARTGVAAVNAVSEGSGPSSRGVRASSVANRAGLSKASQASGKSRC